MKNRIHTLIFMLFTLLASAAVGAEGAEGVDLTNLKMRVARPTNDLTKILKFYRDGLGLKVIAEFKEHEGFNGVMLGQKNSNYHFEFTTQKDHVVPPAPTRDNLVVFYVANKNDYEAALKRMSNEGFKSVPSYNPYWDRGGKTFEDHDGYRVVLYNGTWDR